MTIPYLPNMTEWFIYYELAGVAMAELCMACLKGGRARGGMYLLCLIGWPAVGAYIAWFLWSRRPRG